MRSIFPKLEKIAVDSTVSHFLLMFGYKLFSAYFSLFLVERGLSITKVGYTYLLIYLAIAVAAPIVGAILYRWNASVLSSLGILGYGIYALGMIVSKGALFDIMQIVLGISAALFFVSSRAILVQQKLSNYNSAFGWFYSAPYYADFFAPIIGGVLIWKFGFTGVFIVSTVVHILNVIFNVHTLFKSSVVESRPIAIRQILTNYHFIFSHLRAIGALPILLSAFAIVLAAGLHNAFFVLFLGKLGMTRESIILFTSVFTLVFIPISLFLVKILHRTNLNMRYVLLCGGFLFAMSYIVVGLFAVQLGFLGILAMSLISAAGGLFILSLRSGLLSKNFSGQSQEVSVIDAAFSPLGTAIGAFIGGILTTEFGYGPSLAASGLFVLVIILFSLNLKTPR